ncbi:MAG TPA: hypothetical protein DDW90_08035 [Cyanobacteria bacterium UBA9971]|nr:hypothetical protein [Cyanobacteria bacterium UBA9971]
MKIFIIALIISLSLINSAFAYKNYEWGKVEFKKGNYAKANELFKNELAENPENLKCRYIYAQSFVGINNLAKAQKEYEKVIEQSPNSELAKLSSIAISKIHGYYSGESQEPPITLGSPIGDNYIQVAAHNGKITRWNISKMPLKIYIEPSEYYTAVVAAMDSWVKISEPKTISYTLTNNYKNANIIVTFVASLDPGKAGLSTTHTIGYFLKPNFIKLKTTNAANSPYSQEKLFNLAQHELGHALGILGHSPKEADIMYFQLSNYIKNLSQRDINTLKLLYRLDPDLSNFANGETPMVNSVKNDVFIGNKDGRLDKKIQKAVDYVKKDPKNALNWTKLGNLYYYSRQYQNAITCYQKALEINSSFDAAISGLAFVYEKTGDFNKAVTQFTKLVKQKPDDLNYAHNFALYLIYYKKSNEALRILNNLIKVNPDAKNDRNIKNLMNYLKNPG